MSVGQRNIPADLQSILDELACSERAAQALVEGLTDVQLNWQPHDAAWSIAQCLDHLARINSTYAAALRAAVQGRDAATVPRRHPIQPGWFSRFFIRAMDGPARRKFSAPARAKPALHISREEAIKSFVDSHNEVRALVLENLR